MFPQSGSCKAILGRRNQAKAAKFVSHWDSPLFVQGRRDTPSEILFNLARNSVTVNACAPNTCVHNDGGRMRIRKWQGLLAASLFSAACWSTGCDDSDESGESTAASIPGGDGGGTRDSSPGPNDGGTDAIADSGGGGDSVIPDATQDGSTEDGSPDASKDSGIEDTRTADAADSSADVNEVGPDAGIDAKPEGGVHDSGAEAAVDASAEAGNDAGLDANSNTDGQTGVDAEPEAGADADSGCTDITLGNLVVTRSTDLQFKAEALVQTPLGGADEDVVLLQLFDPQTAGTFDLSTPPDDNYEACEHCVALGIDWPVDADDPVERYFQSAGTLTLTKAYSAADPSVRGSLKNVKLIEVTMDPDTFHTTPVPNGKCITIKSLVFDYSPPDAGTP